MKFLIFFAYFLMPACSLLGSLADDLQNFKQSLQSITQTIQVPVIPKITATNAYMAQYAVAKKNNFKENPAQINNPMDPLSEKDIQNITDDLVKTEVDPLADSNKVKQHGKIAQQALDLEKQFLQDGKITFFNGRSKKFIILDVINEVEGKYSPFLGQPKDEKNKTAFEKIRAYGQTASDKNPELRKRMVPVNVSLFGNLYNYNDNSFGFFSSGTTIAIVDTLIAEILRSYDYDNPGELRDQLIQVYNKYVSDENPDGQLLLIAIPWHKINQYVYPSFALGIPRPKFSSMQEFMQWYTDPHIKNFRDFDEYQARILDPLFSPEDNVSIKILTTMDPQILQDLKSELGQTLYEALSYEV